MNNMSICRYCGGTVKLVPAKTIYGNSTLRLGLEDESIYLCQNCNARVGCHKGTKRPLGNLANEVLRLKRMETHSIFDAFWKNGVMSRTQAYRWLSEQMGLSEECTHIGSFEMDACEQVIRLCREYEKTKEAA